MTLIMLDIPERHEDLASWIEAKVISCDLAQLIGELNYVADELNAELPVAPTLEAILQDKRELVLEEGLQPLSQKQLSILLSHPELLLELQELVLCEGGDYWLQLVENTDEIQPCELPPLSEMLTSDSDTSNPVQGIADLGASDEKAQVLKPIIKRRGLGVMGFMISAAALVVVGVVALQFVDPPKDPGGTIAVNDPLVTPDNPDNVPGPGTESTTVVMKESKWGWDSPEALDDSLPAAEYLQSLASSAEAWFKKRPDTNAGLHDRLAEFRHGCQTLLDAPHASLSDADREWLREKCRAWAGEIEQLTAQAEKTDDVIKVRDAADDLINRLSKALSTKATELS